MKTICINGTDLSEAFDILGDFAGFFGDNGGDPDGNAWLPHAPIDPGEVHNVLSRSDLFFVAEVSYYDIPEDIDALTEYARARGALSPEHFIECGDADNLWDAVCAMLDSVNVAWAGYFGFRVAVLWK